MKFKKIVMLVALVLIIILIAVVIDLYIYNFGLIDTCKSLTMQEVEDVYTVNNSKTFKPKEIKNYLSEDKEEYSTKAGVNVSLTNSGEVLYPLIPKNISNFYNYDNTVFSKDGDYYMSVGDLGKASEVKEQTIYVKYLGRGKPVVLEVQFPTYRTVLYIQCYTNEALNFFINNDNLSNIPTFRLGYDVKEASTHKQNRPDVSTRVENTVPKDILNIMYKHKDNMNGVLTFYEEGEWQFNYYRVIGNPYDILCEYRLKMIHMGNVFMSYDDKVNYSINFENLTVVIRPLTLNSCLVYNFSKLQ